MAITIGDLVERLEGIHEDLENLNLGHARKRTENLIDLLRRSGVTIHATAREESKKVEESDRDQEEE